MPDPDELQLNSFGEIDGILEVRCETPNHPTFQVQFQGCNPFNDIPDAVFDGSIESPVVIPLNKTGPFVYFIQHFHKSGKPSKLWGPHPCSIHSCGPCR